MRKYNFLLILATFFAVFGLFSMVIAASLADQLSGRIVLQVESHGEAWYINPVNKKRYYLGRPADAFEIMRKLGLGISNADLAKIPVADDSPTPPSEQAKAWHTVATFNGQGMKNTSTFNIRGEKWRVNWQTTGEHNFILSAEKTDGSLSGCTFANIIGSGSDTSYCYEKGDFYLSVISGNNWSVTVEDYY